MQFYLVCRTPWSAYAYGMTNMLTKKEGEKKKEKLRALGNFKNCTFRIPLVRYFNFFSRVTFNDSPDEISHRYPVHTQCL